MKKCPYCGKKYSDEMEFCLVDSEPLRELAGNPSPPLAADTDKQEVEKSYVAFPNYKWFARDAWKCLGMLLVFELVIGLFLAGLDSTLPVFHRWHRTGYGYLSARILYVAIDLLAVAYFARTDSPAIFARSVGMNRKPTDFVWFGIAFALALRILTHFLYANGWAKGYATPSLLGASHAVGMERYFYLSSPLLAAFYEEPIMRGFLYKAFRGSYTISTSVLLILAITACNHWSQYSHSAVAAISLSSLTIVLCALREKSKSLWDCIICHLVFNASNPASGWIFR